MVSYTFIPILQGGNAKKTQKTQKHSVFLGPFWKHKETHKNASISQDVTAPPDDDDDAEHVHLDLSVTDLPEEEVVKLLR